MDSSRRRFSRYAIATSAGWLAGCGGGGGSDASNAASIAGGSGPTSSSAVTYTAVAAAGELLLYTVDPLARLFRYTIIDSMFGLGGRNAGGLLFPAPDGVFFPEGLPDSRIATLPTGLMIGVVREVFRGATGQTVPIIGIQAPATGLAPIAGTYNYVLTGCAQGGGSCTAGYGTLTINGDATWSLCGGTNANACAPSMNGTLNALAENRWQMLAGATEIGTLVASSIAGQRLALVDLKDTRAGGLGVGALVATAVVPVTTGMTNGLWYFNATDGSSGFFNLSGAIAAGLILGGASFGSALLLNAPGLGFIQTLQGGIGLIASQGVYVLQQNGRFEIGLKLR